MSIPGIHNNRYVVSTGKNSSSGANRSDNPTKSAANKSLNSGQVEVVRVSAQRTGWVPSEKHYGNDRSIFTRRFAPQPHGPAVHSHNSNQNLMNDYMIAKMALDGLNTLAGDSFKLASMFLASDGSAQKAGGAASVTMGNCQKTGAQDGVLGNSVTDTTLDASISPSISDMASAEDSVTLRSAIESAEKDYKERSKALEGKKADYEQSKTALQKKKTALKEAKQKHETMKKEKTKAESGKRKAESGVHSAKGNLKAAKDHYGDATRGLTDAQKKYAFAKQERISAEGAAERAAQALSNIEAALNKPNLSDAGRTSLQAQQQAAEQAKQAADEALKNAKKAEQDAEKAVTDSEHTVQEANDKMQAAEKELTDAEKGLTVAEKDLAEAEKTLVEAEKQEKQADEDVKQLNNDISELNDKIKEYEDGQNSVKKYKDEIDKQKERLEKLEKKDEKKEKKLQGKIDRNQKRLNNAKTSYFQDKYASRIERYTDKQDPIERRNDIAALLRQEPTMTTRSGKKLRQGIDSNGEPIYMIDNSVVPKTAYDIEAGNLFRQGL